VVVAFYGGVSAVSLGYDIVGALPGLQAQAESMMLDTVRIRRKSNASPTPDPVTGDLVSSYTTIYEGKCRLVLHSKVVANVDAQSQLLAVQEPELHVPVAVAGVQVGDEFELLSGDGVDGQIVGVHPQTFKTARRFPVKIAS